MDERLLKLLSDIHEQAEAAMLRAEAVKHSKLGYAGACGVLQAHLDSIRGLAAHAMKTSQVVTEDGS